MARGKFRPHITTWDLFDLDDTAGDPFFYDSLILAEGDSWFTIGGLFAPNLLMSMRFHKETLILNCASPGDTIVHMSALAHNYVYKESLRYNYAWDAILLSGGGNDLIDRADEIILDKAQRQGLSIQGPADYCDQEKLDRLVDDIQLGYRSLVSVRDNATGPARDTPIFVHTYDYSTPRNAPAQFIVATLGPWIVKALTRSEVPKHDWLVVTDYLFDQLAEGILELTRPPHTLPNFHVIDTRKTIKRAELNTVGNSGDWLNEIHPNEDGYKKLAKKIEKRLEPFL
ncbi:MAG TPA: hypothetical protein VM011_09130 [Gammaproteobacteria bacterium]|nr:hypothetical protein [Gammaproteobacteria bacterium]